MSVIHGPNYGTPTLDLNFAGNKSLIDTVSGQNLVTFSRSQTNYLTTYVGSDGLIKYASANEPRFDHNPVTGESLGLLIEESRTNLLTYSEDFSNAAWGKNNVTITSNVILAPDGSQSAEKLVTTNGTTRNLIYQNNTNSAQKTVSCFVRSAEWNFASIGFSNVGGVWSVATFNLITGQYVSRTDYSTPNISSYSISPAGNGWYRISATITGATNFVVIMPSFTSGDVVNPSWTGDGTSGIYIWGAQLETGSFPTSYIPTSGSTVIRTADNAEITGTNFSRWYNQSEGTAFVQTRNINSADFSLAPFIGFNGSGSLWDNVQEWGVRYNSTGNTFETSVWDSSGSISSLFNSGDRRSSAKVAMGLNTTSAALSVNGNIQQVTRTGGTMPSINSLLWHVNNDPRQSTQFSRFTYYPTRLQNFQLQQLTK